MKFNESVKQIQTDGICFRCLESLNFWPRPANVPNFQNLHNSWLYFALTPPANSMSYNASLWCLVPLLLCGPTHWNTTFDLYWSIWWYGVSHLLIWIDEQLMKHDSFRAQALLLRWVLRIYLDPCLNQASIAHKIDRRERGRERAPARFASLACAEEVHAHESPWDS